MNKLYKLYADSKNLSSFIQYETVLDSYFYIKYWNWKKVELESYQPIKLELRKSDNGKKNYQFDLTVDNNLLVLSEKAVDVLKPILENKGLFLEIVTDSKRKKFIGFYPNNVYSHDIANLDKSDWGQSDKGKIFFKMVFKTYPEEEYIFAVDGSALNIYATEKFKQIVEENDLKGLFFEELVVI